MPDPQEMAAAALQGGAMPEGAAPAQGAPQGNKGGLAELAQAYGRAEAGELSPQDGEILQQGLPQLEQMVENIKRMLAAAAQMQQGGGAQAPMPQ